LKSQGNKLQILPIHGRIDCSRCFNGCGSVEFDVTKRTEADWRITANPLAWGSTNPEVLVLGFSKGPSQAGALASTPHDQIAYKGGRTSVGRILARVGLIQKPDDSASLSKSVDRLIAEKNGRFHFGSLIRCTVERRDGSVWKGSGGGMLDKFVASDFGKEISSNCTSQFLKELPSKTRLIVMFGMGTKQKYVSSCLNVFKQARGGDWKSLNDVSYTDNKVTVVHVEHFASQGALIPNWLGANGHPRSRFADMAVESVSKALRLPSELDSKPNEPI
jgi:hypothetical protein